MKHKHTWQISESVAHCGGCDLTIPLPKFSKDVERGLAKVDSIRRIHRKFPEIYDMGKVARWESELELLERSIHGLAP